MVGISDIEPEGSVVSQDAAAFAEDLGDMLDVEFGSRFEAEFAAPGVAEGAELASGRISAIAFTAIVLVGGRATATTIGTGNVVLPLVGAGRDPPLIPP